MEMYTKEIVVGLGIVVAALVFAVARLEWRLKKLLRGHKAETVEESLSLIEHDMEDLKHFKKEMTKYLSGVEKRLGKSIQGIGTIRFNPFKGNGEGGNQSFASSFLSEKGDGLVLSSLYSRDRVSIFAKPVKGGKSEYELTSEEREALQHAQQQLKM